MSKRRLILAAILAVALTVTLIPTTAMGATGAKGFSGKSAAAADNLIKVAKSKIGKPYVAGAAGPNAFDCSGYVHWVMKKCGIKLTRGSSASYNKRAYNVGRSISKAKKGDILLYYRGGRIGHCGIYIGGGKVIHATVSGGIRITGWNTFGQSLAGVIRTFNQSGEIKITVKSDDDNIKLNGRKFKVTKGNYSKTVKTNKKGQITVSGLAAGKYTVKPVDVDDDYVPMDSRKVTVRVGKTSKLTFVHEYKPGSATFTASIVDRATLDKYLEDLAEYEAYINGDDSEEIAEEVTEAVTEEAVDAVVEEVAESVVQEATDTGDAEITGEENEITEPEDGEVTGEAEEPVTEMPVFETLDMEGTFKILIKGPGMEDGKVIDINANGTYELPNLTYGEYTIEILESNGSVAVFSDIFEVQPGENTAVQLYFAIETAVEEVIEDAA